MLAKASGQGDPYGRQPDQPVEHALVVSDGEKRFRHMKRINKALCSFPVLADVVTHEGTAGIGPLCRAVAGAMEVIHRSCFPMVCCYGVPYRAAR